MDLLEFGRTLNISPFPVMFAVLLLLLGILYFKLHSGPPGPWGLPFLGLWPFVKEKNIHIHLQKLIKKYGDVYGFKYAGKLYIHLGSIKAVKEAVVTKADCFTERFSGFSFLNTLYKEGMLVENAEPWGVLRKFFIGAFREHGMTVMKDYMSGPILDSVNSTVDDLRSKNGTPVDIISILSTRSSEILRRVMFNDDGMSAEEVKEILKEYEKIAPAFAITLLNGEFVRYFLFPFIKEFKTALESHKIAASILKEIVTRHEASFDKDNVRDIVDSYIQERNERRAKGDPTAEYFTENALVSSLLQFVGDGITAIAMFIAFFLNTLLERPEEQEKIHKELEEVIGSDRQPTLQDKTKLPYLNAYIQEVQRTMEFIHIFIDVECTKTTTLNGHQIPKGALLLVNVYACHRDPNTFDEPAEFRPSRYIVHPGQQRTEAPILFGMGRRSCIGQPFVMMQVFLFLAAVLKNFRLTRPEGTTKKIFPDLVLEICAHPRK